METVLAGQDKIIIFGNPQHAAIVFEQFEIALVRRNGKMALGIQASGPSAHEKKDQNQTPNKSANKKLNPITRPSDYQPMGARQKSVAKEIKQFQVETKQLPPLNPPPSSSSQYVPRGAVKIHPIASPLKNDLNESNIEKKIDPPIDSKRTTNSTSSRFEVRHGSRSPRYDTTVHTEEKIE